jgi:pre-rRNA-processing protein RIX1
MSTLSELRALCHLLSSTPNTQLPYVTPVLLYNVLRCHGPLSSSEVLNTSKSSASESSVLVHKLKTQLSTLLYGKSSEGRFSAVVLIKTVVDIGGWEVLRGAESWVRGLLSILEVHQAASFYSPHSNLSRNPVEWL